MNRLIRTAVAATALTMIGPLAGPAAARTLITYPLSVNLDLTLTQRSHWKGIKPGCWAPQENFDVDYHLRFRTHPRGAASAPRTRPSTVTLPGGTMFGATPFFGAPGGATQWASGGQWELEVGYPAGCGPDPAPPVPANITSPTCRSIAERVAVSLLPADNPGRDGDGTIVIRRTPRTVLAARGAAIGPSCLRTLHDLEFATRDSHVFIDARTTMIVLPFPRLHHRLLDLGIGRPSFTTTLAVSGDCWNLRARPAIGAVEGFTPSPNQPHDAIGQGWSDPGDNACMLSGSGRVTITRTGPITRTVFPG